MVAIDGAPTAQLGPLPPRPLPVSTLIARRQPRSPVDPVQFRAEIDELFDPVIAERAQPGVLDTNTLILLAAIDREWFPVEPVMSSIALRS